MNIKEKILKLLSEHAEGLTFTQIAVEVGMHRHTVTNYVHELRGEGKISIRDLKTLKLCYLKKYFQGSKVNK
jgi:DNA-binding IclR family transcriptional regulator